MKICIIYTNSITKIENQLELLKNMDFIKNNNVDFYIYNKIEYINNNEFKYEYDYNIYIDIISETLYNKLPAKYTILLVNDNYLLNNNYLRREYYKNEPLKLLDNCVNFYFCLTKYSYNILSTIINKKKLYLFNGFTSTIEYYNKNITIT